MYRFLLGVLVTISYCSAEKVRYDNYTLYRFTPRNEREVDFLKRMEITNPAGYDFWTSARSIGNPVDILVPPNQNNDLTSISKVFGMDAEVLMENIQQQIDREDSLLKSEGFNWQSYNSIEKINDWLASLAQQYPDVVTLIKGGSTYEKRDILGVKVSYNKNNSNTAVWIDSNIHAREWISGAVNTFILNELVTKEKIKHLAVKHDWYIFPVINPDGYAYTFEKNRLWRKTRTPHGRCFGADPNRNWDYKWNTVGASSDPCSDVYAGPHAFSELSTSTLSKFISKISSQIQVYISFHSYSQLILLPYGHTKKHLDNYNVTYPIGVKAAKSLSRRYGTTYEVGNIPEILYPATGSSMDYAKGVHHVPYAFTYELRDEGNYGFLLPPEQIIPAALETLDSVLTIVEETDKLARHI